MSSSTNDTITQSTAEIGSMKNGNASNLNSKPPRPNISLGSLDRRRPNQRMNRYERDSKSRSTHSLKEKSTSSEFTKDNLSSVNYSRGNNTFDENRSIHEKFSIFKEHLDSAHYPSSGSSSVNHHRHSPGIWEAPPPPPWDPHHCWNYHHSREELRMMDYHRRQAEMYQYGSNGALSSAPDLCCNRNFYAPPTCYSCDYNRSMILWNNQSQV